MRLTHCSTVIPAAWPPVLSATSCTTSVGRISAARRAGFARVFGRHLQVLLVAGRPAAHRLPQMRLGRISCLALAPFERGSHLLHSFIDTAVLRRPDHKVRLLLPTRQKERVDVTVAISHMHPHLLLWLGIGAHPSPLPFPPLPR